MLVYMAKPISWISPLCDSPSTSPAPRDFEIVHGKEEAGAELLHGLDRVEAALGLRRRLGILVGQQVGVGLMVRAADAAAQLVQLARPNLSARLMTMVLACGLSMRSR